MGFRNRRRHRGGGGGGGGGQHHHGFFGGEANGLNPGDDVGNRKNLKPVQYVPEDLGNRRDPDEAEWVPEDDVGNRVFEAPTHELSGTLLDLDGKRRRRRPKGVSAPERVGRFLVGGVNPLVAGGLPRPGLEAAHQAFEAAHQQQQNEERAERGGRDGELRRDDRPQERRDGRDGRDARGPQQQPQRPRRFESPDGAAAAHDVSDRRAQRFFDFAEDDRFEYTLKSTPEQKRKEGEDFVNSIVKEAGRDATVIAKLLEDGTRPKVLVCIEERGPAAELPAERRGTSANDPLFVLGNGALMSLNYLANKVVNRYPDDRIRLAVLPASDEKLYLESLADHQRTRAPRGAPVAPAPTPAVAVAPVAPVAVTPVVPASVAPVAVTPAPASTRVHDAMDDTEEIVTVAAAEEETIEAEPASAPKKKAAPKKAASKPAASKPAKKADDDDEAPKKKVATKAAKKADDDDDKKKPAKKPVKKSAPAVSRVVLKR